MIDEDKLAQVQAAMLGDVAPEDGLDLDAMTHDELRELRDEIDRRLPEDSLDSLNLEKELVGQYRRVKRLQDDVIMDDEIPPNQRSQVAGQVASTLKQLVDMQVDLKQGEQMKRMEAAFLDAIEDVDEDVKAKFFANYDVIATNKGAMD